MPLLNHTSVASTEAKNTQYTAYNAKISDDKNNVGSNWGTAASRSLYSSHINLGEAGSVGVGRKNLLESRLWKGVPQLSESMIDAFEAAYTGHTFIFCVNMPRFLTTGIYYDKNAHYLMKNFKSIMERASTGVDGVSDYTAEFATMTDNPGQKLDHVINVVKEQNDINVRLHEFAGLPVKNALETWLTGIYDPKSQHGNYHGNLGIPGGWCMKNHTMSMLVVQVNPSWTEIQDAVYYYNMIPTSVPMAFANWTKGEYSIVDNVDITFKCNEERSPAITYAAEKFVNNRILSFAATSMFNSRQFSDNGKHVAGLAAIANDDWKVAKEDTHYNYKLTSDIDNTSGVDPLLAEKYNDISVTGEVVKEQ